MFYLLLHASLIYSTIFTPVILSMNEKNTFIRDESWKHDPNNPAQAFKERDLEHITELALKTNNIELLELVFQQGLSPDSTIQCIENFPITDYWSPIILKSSLPLWSVFKKYGANFNVKIPKKYNGRKFYSIINPGKINPWFTNPEYNEAKRYDYVSLGFIIF